MRGLAAAASAEPHPHPGFASHLEADHNVGDRWSVVLLVRLLCEHRKHKVPRLALTLPHQEAARTPLFQQQLLSLLARQVPMVPPDQGQGVGAQVRLGVTAWPGEGGTDPDTAGRLPDRPTNTSGAQAAVHPSRSQFSPPTTLTLTFPRAGRRQDRRALQGPGWPPGGSLVLSKKGKGHFPRAAPPPNLAGAAPSGLSSAVGKTEAGRTRSPHITSQEGRGRLAAGLLPHTNACIRCLGPRGNDAPGPRGGLCRTPRSLLGYCTDSGRSPLGRGVLAAQRVPKLDRGPAALPEKRPPLAGVVLHQLRQRRKLLPTIQIVIVSCVLDLDVGHLILAPERAGAPAAVGRPLPLSPPSASRPSGLLLPRVLASAWHSPGQGQAPVQPVCRQPSTTGSAYPRPLAQALDDWGQTGPQDSSSQAHSVA